MTRPLEGANSPAWGFLTAALPSRLWCRAPSRPLAASIACLVGRLLLPNLPRNGDRPWCGELARSLLLRRRRSCWRRRRRRRTRRGGSGDGDGVIAVGHGDADG